jgi:type VI secretion system secreted protein VgrG
MAWVRDKALMAMTSPLGGDVLIPTHLAADEAISRPFRFDIMVVSQNGVIDPNTLLNQPVCVTLQGADGPVRYFHGIVQQVRPGGVQRGDTAIDEFQLYALTVVPRMWFLGQTRDCRVYQAVSSKDILTAMFGDAGLTDFSFSVSSAVARPYTVQFNESDYNFACRLMEQEGWFFFHQHTDSAHTLVIADANTAFTAIADATLHFTANANDADGILEWRPPVRTVTGSVAMGDYDPENPGTNLYSMQNTVLTTGGATARDVYYWPAATPTNSLVEGRSKFGIEAAEAATSLYNGSSLFGAFVPGGTFTLTNSPASPDDGTFALRSVQHVIEDSTWMTSTGGSVSYHNRFEALKTAVPWRQPMTTPWPRMDGVHSALVMGPQSDAKATISMQSGEEIYTDDLARVKVRFYWDWRAEATGGASVWARVIQPWAGNGWGTQFIPRVGTEVAVTFVDGDPDRPMVIGGLYNGVSAPIYAVADKTKTGIRTRSSLSGSTSQFNEFTFDDKSGSELVYLHAEKDLTTEVEHDESLTVDNCRVVLVKADETITVQGKQTITVTKDHTFEVTQGNYKSTIDVGTSTVTVSTGDSTFEVSQGNHSETIGQGNHSLTVSTGNQSTTVSKGNQSLTVSLGNITVQASAGAISMEATKSLTLKVGANSITIDPSGVTIKGTMVSIQGTASTSIKGLMTTVNADVQLGLKGAITMVN